MTGKILPANLTSPGPLKPVDRALVDAQRVLVVDGDVTDAAQHWLLDLCFVQQTELGLLQVAAVMNDPRVALEEGLGEEISVTLITLIVLLSLGQNLLVLANLQADGGRGLLLFPGLQEGLALVLVSCEIFLQLEPRVATFALMNCAFVNPPEVIHQVSSFLKCFLADLTFQISRSEQALVFLLGWLGHLNHIHSDLNFLLLRGFSLSLLWILIISDGVFACVCISVPVQINHFRFL